MATHVQVILKEDVEHLGTVGQVVKVRPGYARNYLLPRGMAALATRGSVSQIEHEKKAALAKADKLKVQAAGIAAALEAVVIRIEKNAGDEGKLYGSVTAAEIAEALGAKGYEVDKRKIQMPADPIKQVGTYEVTAKLAGGVSGKIHVEVAAQADG